MAMRLLGRALRYIILHLFGKRFYPMRRTISAYQR
uniref:Uncharacterized protein n=1 Tax=Anguilla anguilla TaxID=7936 RepID=A0A0E9RTV2_ANGAN